MSFKGITLSLGNSDASISRVADKPCSLKIKGRQIHWLCSLYDVGGDWTGGTLSRWCKVSKRAPWQRLRPAPNADRVVLSLRGLCCFTGTIEVDRCLNDAIYGEGSSPADILDGKVLLLQQSRSQPSLRLWEHCPNRRSFGSSRSVSRGDHVLTRQS